MSGASLQPAAWLMRRDLIRFGRQPSRIIAAIGTPALIWLLLGSGFAGSFISPPAAPSASAPSDYAAYLIPGMASMVVLFSSIFAAIGLIEDRHAGFLQAALVSPAPMWQVIGGKLGAGGLIALAQGVVVVLASPLVGAAPTFTGVLLAVLALATIALGISGIGMAAAWRVDSSQGFHGVMNLVLMPMWLLSGAVFPVSTSSAWMSWLMRLNPLTWPTEALRASLDPAGPRLEAGWWLGSAAFAAAGVILPALVIRRRSRRPG